MRQQARFAILLGDAGDCRRGYVGGPAKTFRLADQGDVLSMDPYMVNESLLLSFTGNLYEGLTGYGKKLELVPELATDWKQTAPRSGVSICARE